MIEEKSSIENMESTRQQKINRLIQKELSEIFLIETKQMKGVLVSVSRVRVSPDLGLAKAYLSIFPSSEGNAIVENIKKNARTIRFDLGQRIGKQVRVIPELAFYIDDSLDYIENIDKLLKSDKKNDEE